MSASEHGKTKAWEAYRVSARESQEDLIERLGPDCTCPDDLCLGEDGGCTACSQIDPEWDCLRALLDRPNGGE